LPKTAVQAFCDLLQRTDTQRALEEVGFHPAKKD
jgi:hypothetical protein